MSGEKNNKLLRNWLKNNLPKQSFIAKVIAVDETNFTCDVEPIDEGPTRYKVRLKPSIDSDDNGIICIPEDNSELIVSIAANNENYCYVSVFGKIKRFLIKTSNGTFEIDAAGTLKLNGDDKGGVPQVNELTAKLNAMVGEINAQLTLIQTGIVAAGGTYTPADISNFAASDYENTKVKHGS